MRRTGVWKVQGWDKDGGGSAGVSGGGSEGVSEDFRRFRGVSRGNFCERSGGWRKTCSGLVGLSSAVGIVSNVQSHSLRTLVRVLKTRPWRQDFL